MPVARTTLHAASLPERELFIDNLLVRIHLDFGRPALRHRSLNSLPQVA